MAQFWSVRRLPRWSASPTAFVQQYRFAAADSGDAPFRARAISWVLAGGIAAAIIGPQTVIFTQDLLRADPVRRRLLRHAVLWRARSRASLSTLGGQARAAPKADRHAGGRPLGEIVRQPRFIVAVICGIGSYALMAW